MNLPLSTNKKEGAKTVRNSSKDATKVQITCPVKKQKHRKIDRFLKLEFLYHLAKLTSMTNTKQM